MTEPLKPRRISMCSRLHNESLTSMERLNETRKREQNKLKKERDDAFLIIEKLKTKNSDLKKELRQKCNRTLEKELAEKEYMEIKLENLKEDNRRLEAALRSTKAQSKETEKLIRNKYNSLADHVKKLIKNRHLQNNSAEILSMEQRLDELEERNKMLTRELQHLKRQNEKDQRLITNAESFLIKSEKRNRISPDTTQNCGFDESFELHGDTFEPAELNLLKRKSSDDNKRVYKLWKNSYSEDGIIVIDTDDEDSD